MSKYSKDLIPVDFVQFLILMSGLHDTDFDRIGISHLRALIETWKQYADTWEEDRETVKEELNGIEQA